MDPTLKAEINARLNRDELQGTPEGRFRARLAAECFDHVRLAAHWDKLADEEKAKARKGQGNPTLRAELRAKAQEERAIVSELWQSHTLS